jgi:putative ABC transport system ATP-binding protein
LTPGQLVASELIVAAVVNKITDLGDVLKSWYDVCAASGKLGMLVDLPLERQDGEPLPPGQNGVAVELRNVECGRSDGRAEFERFDLKLGPGERVALIGSPRSSTSRLLDVLFGLREPTGGHVTVEGLDLRQLRLDTTRDDFSLVHGTEIVEGSILDNLRFGRSELTSAQIRDALIDVGLNDELLGLPDGLDTQLTTRGQPLSTCQANRLMLARAIVREPRLLLLDGVLDTLSPTVRRQVVDHLFDRRHRWTVIVVTQMQDVAAACDRRIELEPSGSANGALTNRGEQP